MPFASRTNWSRFPPIRQRQCSRSPCDAKSRYLDGVKCQKSFSFRQSRGSDLRLLRLTMDGLPDQHIWGATPCIRIVRVRRSDLTNLDPLAGKIRTFGEDPIFFIESIVVTPVLRCDRRQLLKRSYDCRVRPPVERAKLLRAPMRPT